MKIAPITNPGAVAEFNQTHSTEAARYQQAIKAASGLPTKHNQPAAPAAQPQQAAVPNQNAISPEEMSAIKPQAKAETQTTETPVETPAPVAEKQPTEAEEQANRRFIMLAKQEKALRAREQAIKQREAELQAQSQQPQQPKFDESQYIAKDRFKQDPLAVMAETGLSYEELTNMLLNQPNRDPRVEAEFSSLKAEIQKLREASEQAKQEAQQQQTQAYQAAVKQIESDVKNLVTQDPSYEAIRTAGAYKDVVELIEQTYQKDGVLLTNEEACQLVEDYLIEEYTKLTNIDKIKKRLMPAPAAKVEATSAKTSSESNQPQQPTMKTLTNNTSSSRKLSARERALLAFNGELKK